MSWDAPPKQAAVDPDNPAANEQVPFSEWNDMVAYLKDKIIDKAVNAAAIGDGKILVYDLASDAFVFADQSTVAAINGLTDVTISGVPADNEVLAYDTGSSDWINQTASEAGLATVAGLAACLPLAGGTMTGTLNMGDQRLEAVDDLQANDTSGILFRTNSGIVSCRIGSTGTAFMAYYDCDMNSHKLINVTDPTSAQDASTKNYDDTHLFAKEVVTSFMDGCVPVYRTMSGRFEMEEQTTYLPLAGGTMAGDLNMGDQRLCGVNELQAHDGGGAHCLDFAGSTRLIIGSSAYSFDAGADASMNSYTLHGVGTPTSNDHASNKGYDDAHLFAKEAVTSFLDGYIPVYRTASGKFEMEAGGGSAGLPVSDSTFIVAGNLDGTKKMRFEVDGFAVGNTERIMTIPDQDITLCGVDDVMLRSGANAMVGDINLGGHNIENCFTMSAEGSASQTTLKGGTGTSAAIGLYGNAYFLSSYRGTIRMFVPNAAGSASVPAMTIDGLTDTPIIVIYHGLDMNAADIDDIGAMILNDATELTIASGTVTVTQSYHTIDTQADASTDDLTTINGGTAGQIVVLRAMNAARTVVAKAGIGNLQLTADMSLDSVLDTLTLIYSGTNWMEIARANNGA